MDHSRASAAAETLLFFDMMLALQHP
jgi:hypothetical protein